MYHWRYQPYRSSRALGLRDKFDPLGQSLHRIFTVEDREMGVPEREIGQAISQGRADDDRWHLRADGQQFWASGVVMPIWENGQFAGVIKIIRDLTERVEAESRRHRQTEQLAEQFQQLAETIPQMVWISDLEGNDLYFNPRWEAFSGLTSEQLNHHGWNRLIDGATRAHVTGERADALARRGDWEATFQMRHRDGSYHWCLCRALPIRDAEGEIIRWFSSCTDVDAMLLQSQAFEKDAIDQRAVNVRQDAAIAQSNQDLSN
ncbi:PAS domain-containing protein [Pseudomonas oryzihabitans]|uniref:PAS domain-containing protein n=1 Tax=Pseudomonas oryzihabitans TaxID=47885 RepID=UPI001D3BA764|nr:MULTISPECIES: PAS domain S-box protein [Pseudomonas]HJE67104.1 PAS domain S-box protein [Pseudomonas oryzihabitans]